MGIWNAGYMKSDKFCLIKDVDEMAVRSYRDLDVWKKGMILHDIVCEITQDLSYVNRSLVDQMRRSAESIPSNIAEGNGRKTTKEYLHFLSIAQGSLNELQTQLGMYASNELGHTEELRKAMFLTADIGRMLNKLVFSLKQCMEERNK